MRGLNVLMSALIGIGITAATIGLAAADHQDDRWECDQIPAYQRELIEAMPDDPDGIEALNDTDDPSTMRPSQLREASDEFDEWAGNIEDIPVSQIPRVAREHRVALVNHLSVTSQALLAWGTGGVFAVLPYTESVEQASWLVESTEAIIVGLRCHEQWSDVFGNSSNGKDTDLLPVDPGIKDKDARDDSPDGPPRPIAEAGRNEFAHIVGGLNDAGLEAKPGRYSAEANQLTRPGQTIEVEGQNLFVFIYPDADGAAAVADREADAADLDPATLDLTSKSADQPLSVGEELHVFQNSNVIAVLVGGDAELVETVRGVIESLP